MTLSIEHTRDMQPWMHDETMLFAYDACRIDGECIGWLPRVAYDQADQAGRLFALRNNGDLVGIMLFGLNAHSIKCYQIWVRRDARLIEHGQALVEHAEKIGQKLHKQLLSLWCAEDLPANHFWKSLGFRWQTWRWGSAKQPRRHALWTRPLLRSREGPLLHVAEHTTQRGSPTTPWAPKPSGLANLATPRLNSTIPLTQTERVLLAR